MSAVSPVAQLLALTGLLWRGLCHSCLPCSPRCACHSLVLLVGRTSLSPGSQPSLEKFPPMGSPGQGVEMYFWLLKSRAKLVSQDLTPSSASPGAWQAAFFRVSRASAPLGTAYLPLFCRGQAGSHAHGTWFTHSSPRMPGFRGESPLKMLTDERDCPSMGPWGQTAHLGPINAVFWGP